MTAWLIHWIVKPKEYLKLRWRIMWKYVQGISLSPGIWKQES